MIRATHIGKTYEGHIVFLDMSFTIEQTDKIALVGENGMGKTTLLKMIAGLEETDTGEVSITKGKIVVYIPQDIGTLGNDDENETVLTYIERMCKEYNIEIHKAVKALDIFGLSKEIQNKTLKNISSGQKTKVALSILMVQNPDIILLDEPTNNLDLNSVYVLEDFLKKTNAAILVISHDRQFVDNITNKVFELAYEHEKAKEDELPKLTIVGGSYTSYIEQKEKARITEATLFKNQEAEIERLEESANKLKIKAAKGAKWVGTDNDKFLMGYNREHAEGSARKGKKIGKQIEMMDKVDRPESQKEFVIDVDVSKESGSLDIVVRDLMVGYGEEKIQQNYTEEEKQKNNTKASESNHFTIGPITLDIRFRDRMLFIGENGSGKSTFLKTITGRIQPLEGELLIGSGIRFGNLMQEHENVPKEITLLAHMLSQVSITNNMGDTGVTTDQSISESYNTLQKFGFNEIQIKQNISTLSPGERARLVLASFSFQKINTLVLDEPTNHLDFEALSALQKTIDQFTGTIIAVSHDRFFLQKLGATGIYVFEVGDVKKVKSLDGYLKDAKSKSRKLLKFLI